MIWKIEISYKQQNNKKIIISQSPSKCEGHYLPLIKQTHQWFHGRRSNICETVMYSTCSHMSQSTLWALYDQIKVVKTCITFKANHVMGKDNDAAGHQNKHT